MRAIREEIKKSKGQPKRRITYSIKTGMAIVTIRFRKEGATRLDRIAALQEALAKENKNSDPNRH